MTESTMSFPLEPGTEKTNAYLPLAHKEGLFFGVRPIIALMKMQAPFGVVGLSLGFGVRVRVAVPTGADMPIVNVAAMVKEVMPELDPAFQKKDGQRVSTMLIGNAVLQQNTDFGAVANRIMTEGLPKLVDAIEDMVGVGGMEMEVPRETLEAFIAEAFQPQLGQIGEMLYGLKETQKQVEDNVIPFKLPALEGPDTIQ